MKLHYYRDPLFNFGDDLNEVIWPRVLSKRFLESDDGVLIGIGSILTEQDVGQYSGSAQRVIVLGSGTSYGTPPLDMNGWSVLAVRGPLTASVIGRPEAAATDGAILLALMPDVMGPPMPKDQVLFMPHHLSTYRDAWRPVVESMGITYVTPRQPVDQILRMFARARLVLTEAMHGAIVADTLRIPWVPLAISPVLEEFKWRDWSKSMNVPFRPVRLPAASPVDAMRYARLRRLLKSKGIDGAEHLAGDVDTAVLKEFLERRFGGARSAPKKPNTSGEAIRLIMRPLSTSNALFRGSANRALHIALNTTPTLSEDEIFQRRLNQMREAVSQAEKL